jgi:hypothetical protein
MEPLVTFKIFQSTNLNGFNTCLCWFKSIHSKNDTLQEITLEGLPKNVIPIVLISKTFQYHYQIPQSNTSKTFNINRYQLLLALVFCLIDFKSQGQTFDHLIINLKQPLDNVPINMHNIYVTLSQLHFLDGLVILKDISWRHM